MEGWVGSKQCWLDPHDWCKVTYHDTTEVAGLKLGHGQLDGSEHVRPDTLTEERVEIDGASQELNVPLLQDRHVAIGWRIDELVREAFQPETLVEVNAV